MAQTIRGKDRCFGYSMEKINMTNWGCELKYSQILEEQ